MKKIFEWIGGFVLVLFSFYLTDKVSLLVASKSSLMSDIKSVSGEYKEEPYDAVIDKNKNTIIPGKFGKEVDDEESYLNMHDFGTFNENYLVYNYIKPHTSLEDNLDKYITKGNDLKRNVSIIVENNSEIIKYLTTHNIKYNIIIDNHNDYNITPNEIINGAKDRKEFLDINSKLKKNPHICIKDYSDEALCNELKYYIVKPELTLDSSNIIETKKLIKSGSIILISASNNLENVKLVLNEIKYRDLNPVFISELINERA